MLCCAVLCCAVLCCAVLCCAVPASTCWGAALLHLSLAGLLQEGRALSTAPVQPCRQRYKLTSVWGCRVQCLVELESALPAHYCMQWGTHPSASLADSHNRAPLTQCNTPAACLPCRPFDNADIIILTKALTATMSSVIASDINTLAAVQATTLVSL